MAQDYDFILNGSIGFNQKVSKESPYQRATAQFRKDQVDQQATVGDQSLAGWWTRGQLSFHKGAGVRYYEVTEGETVLNRFDSGEGTNPFTPGQVTIGYAFDELELPSDPVDCAHVVNYITGDRIVALCSDGNIYSITTGAPLASQTVTAIPTTGTADVAAITASRFSVYIAIGKKIEVWSPFDASSTVLWTGTAGNIVGLWYAKQRLWVVDDLGNWFVLSTAGGSFAASDAEFTIKDYAWLTSSPAVWSLTGSPGPVYISAFNEVYAVAVDYDSTTLLPTIGAPVQVVELPGDETIYCLGFVLNTLVMGLGLGLRVGTPDGNGIAYGPRVTNVNFSQVSRIAAVGTRVAMGGFFFDSVGLWSFDLGNMVDTLEPAHALESLVSGAPMVGALSTPQGLVMWSTYTGKLYRRNEAEHGPSGYLLTGFHRFGTLDAKHFASVAVRVGGDGGSIDVYRVDADYTNTLLGTVTYPEVEAEFDLNLDPPTERVALKFVLHRDSSDHTLAPELLGYQLKALPLPKRQRMIRIPLWLNDNESNRSGQRMLADPKDRLQVLEELEESNALVTFEDKIYGETGSAYVESIEFERTAARDFGGTLFLTLRKVST